MSSPADQHDFTTTSPSASMPGISLGLTRIHRLLSLLRSPHLATPVVHIAGTNGKGSVSAYLSSILSHSKLAVGRFNSPHLVDEWDCIQSHGRPVDEGLFYEAKKEVEQVSEREGVGATSFEVLTATAFSLFARARPPLDVAVVEVGMGGSRDATNVVPAEKTLLSVVTAVELDHQKFLGDTVDEIATVKAGITREGGDVVLSVQAHDEATEAVKRVAGERGARVWQAGEAVVVAYGGASREAASSTFPPPPLAAIPLAVTSVVPPLESPSPSSQSSITARLPLPGSYQLQNSATAVLAAQLLRTLPRTLSLLPTLTRITDDSIRTGVEATRWPGRLSWETYTTTSGHQLPLLLDGAHNPSSAALLASYLSSLPAALRPSTLVFALSAPRDPADVVRPLSRALAAGERRLRVVCCGFSTPAGMEWVRSTPASELAAAVKRIAAEEASRAEVQVEEAADAEAALRLVDPREDGEGSVVVAGSLYLVADAMRTLRRRQQAGENS
ncbi:Dihydrofolate synthetase [Rhodotorula toruloides]|nr:Dihydrofolate synthetase [Rhodotorula toruloides]